MRASLIMAMLVPLALAACGGASGPVNELGTPAGHYKVGQPYKINGNWYYPAYDPAYAEVGEASWYGQDFHGLATANGEVFDRTLPTAAHPTLPLPSIVRVTNLKNGKAMTVRVNDRGPFAKGRLIDLSQAAARQLDFEDDGTAPVQVQFLGLAKDATGTPPTPTMVEQRRPAPRTVLAAASPSSAAVRPAGAASCGSSPSEIQVASFGEPWRAHQLMGELVRRRIPGGRSELVRVDGREVVRVKLGPLGSEREASVLLGRLQQMGYNSAYILPSATTRCS